MPPKSILHCRLWDGVEPEIIELKGVDRCGGARRPCFLHARGVSLAHQSLISRPPVGLSALCSCAAQKKMLRRPPTRMAIGSETDMDEYEKEKKQRKDEAKKAPVKLTTEQRIGLQK